MLHAEQGFGDTIQFVRYAPLLAARGAKVILEVQPQLVRLLSGMPGVAGVVARGEPLPPSTFIVRCSACRSRAAPTLQTDPAGVPYIAAADADVAAGVAARCSPRRRPRDRTGVVRRARARQRSQSFHAPCDARAAARPAGVAFVSLQHEVRDEDARRCCERRRDVAQIGQEFRDFADTAAAIAALDAVIAVDTAVAHLAGAMGKPLFLLLPFAADFRWLRGRSDSPWYPTARLFRQPRFGDWDSAVETLRQDTRAVRRDLEVSA